MGTVIFLLRDVQYYPLFHSWYCWLYFFSFYLSLSYWRFVNFIDLCFKESAFYIIDFLCGFPVFNIIKFLCLSLLFPFACFGIPWCLRWLSICLQCRRLCFDSWVGKIPWRREQLPTPVELPREFHGQKSLAGYSPWGRKELDMAERLSLSFIYFG